jgi:DNA-nicking Smr family endonuclease
MGHKPRGKGAGAPPVRDADLFRAAMRGVKPFRSDDREPAPAEPAARPAAPSRAPRPPPAAPLDAPPRATHGPDRRTTVRLRRGQIRPEARLDLHGLTQAEAHAALASFIRGARGAGRRCVLVVTGKGSVATGGVLRREVPRWLELPELRGAILGVTPAHAKDGGSGALYVLLRRKVRG